MYAPSCSHASLLLDVLARLILGSDPELSMYHNSGSKFGAAIVIVHPGLGSLQRFMLMQLVDALLLAARKLPKQQAESKPAASQVKLTDPATAPKTSGCNTNC